MTNRRVTSRDVAARAGVSRTTVSFVLNDVPGVNISREKYDTVREAIVAALRDHKQLTFGEFDDYEPCYLPDGGIVFVSTRCQCWVSCWKTQVGVLYRCDGDGRNIQRLSHNIEHDNTPWVLPDGRVMYMRWEYVDRSRVSFHHLWTANPDGTGQMVYYGNMHPGTLMIDAKPIPRSEKVVAIFSPNHGRRE